MQSAHELTSLLKKGGALLTPGIIAAIWLTRRFGARVFIGLAAVLGMVGSLSAVTTSTELQSRNVAPACNATSPQAGGSYGNPLLSVEGLWTNGTVIFKPGGPGFVTTDGALGMKFGWKRGVRGKVNVTGRRLDGTAGPVRFEASNGMGDIGFQASYLIFPTPGCWQVTARVGDRQDSEIAFVVKVVKVGDGPAWRRDLSD